LRVFGEGTKKIIKFLLFYPLTGEGQTVYDVAKEIKYVLKLFSATKGKKISMNSMKRKVD